MMSGPDPLYLFPSASRAWLGYLGAGLCGLGHGAAEVESVPGVVKHDHQAARTCRYTRHGCFWGHL